MCSPGVHARSLNFRTCWDFPTQIRFSEKHNWVMLTKQKGKSELRSLRPSNQQNGHLRFDHLSWSRKGNNPSWKLSRIFPCNTWWHQPFHLLSKRTGPCLFYPRIFLKPSFSSLHFMLQHVPSSFALLQGLPAH